MNHGSLFSGIGGFDLAASWLGWNNVFQCEKDIFCQKVLKYHFPKTELYGDITKTDFRKHRGWTDVVSGGFPCQPFSLAGSRKGKNDNRYLWPEMLRVVDEVKPAWAVGENVAGITSMVQPGKETEVEGQASLFETHNKETVLEQEYVIETICKDFEGIGYSVQPVLIPACAVGAPHRRDRVWFIANRSDAGVEGVQREREDGIYQSKAFTNPNKFNGDVSRFCSGEISQFKTSEILGDKSSKTDEHTDSKRRKELDITSFANETKRIGRVGLAEGWSQWPTQSAICGRNDGISARLDSDALLNGRKPRQPFEAWNRWRNESVRGFGNAIVPQAAYEIFWIIDFLNKQ